MIEIKTVFEVPIVLIRWKKKEIWMVIAMFLTRNTPLFFFYLIICFILIGF